MFNKEDAVLELYSSTTRGKAIRVNALDVESFEHDNFRDLTVVVMKNGKRVRVAESMQHITEELLLILRFLHEDAGPK